MIVFNSDMKEVISRVRTAVFATASKDKIPNAVPIGFVRIISDGEILLMDNFMNKTRKNLEENPQVAVTAWDREMRKGFQFKGQARIETRGTIFNEGSAWVKSRLPHVEPKAAVIVTVNEIYMVGSGPEAGKRIA